MPRERSLTVTTFVCPETRLDLESMSLERAEERVGVPRRSPGHAIRAEREVLLRSDDACAYPVLEQRIPVLLLPEMLLPEGTERHWDLSAPQYAEAYAEMAHYDAVAEANRHAAQAQGLRELERTSDSIRSLAAIAKLARTSGSRSPTPRTSGWTRRTTGRPSATPIATSLRSQERRCFSWAEPARRPSSFFWPGRPRRRS